MFLFCDPAGFLKELQPIAGLIRFFQRDFKLGDKISFAVGVLCFMNVCTD